MNRRFLKKRTGITLLEVLIVTVVVAVLAAFAIPRIIRQIDEAKRAEAVESLGAIRTAQLRIHDLTGTFMAAEDEAGIQSALGLSIGGGFYRYRIIEADGDNFLALATPTGPLSDWLTEFGINKDGFVGSGFGSGGGGGGGGGGGSGGGGGGGSSGGGGGGGGGSGSGSSGGGSYLYSANSIYLGGAADSCNYTVKPPVNLNITPNDEWLVMSIQPFDLGEDGYYYERAEKTDDVLGDWTFLSATTGGSWEDHVQNGKEYCYRAHTVVTPTGCSLMESDACAMVCASAASNAAYEAAIEAGEITLATANYADPSDGAPSGAAQVAFLNDPDGDPATDDAIHILFGQNQDGSLAYYRDATRTLVLDVDYANQPPELLAVLLAHETLHATWGQDWRDYQNGMIPAPNYGNNPDGTVRHSYSYYNEFSAFTTGAMAWQSFFPDTSAGNTAKQAFYDGLDTTGKSLYTQAQNSADFFLADNGTRLNFPTGIPTEGPVDPNTKKVMVDSVTGLPLNTLQILQTWYGYDITENGTPVLY